MRESDALFPNDFGKDLNTALFVCPLQDKTAKFEITQMLPNRSGYCGEAEQ